MMGKPHFLRRNAGASLKLPRFTRAGINGITIFSGEMPEPHCSISIYLGGFLYRWRFSPAKCRSLIEARIRSTRCRLPGSYFLRRNAGASLKLGRDDDPRPNQPRHFLRRNAGASLKRVQCTCGIKYEHHFLRRNAGASLKHRVHEHLTVSIGPIFSGEMPEPH